VISESVSATIEGVDSKELLDKVFDVNNLVKWWMFLKKIEQVDELHYYAEFRVFMKFKFLMTRERYLNGVRHWGEMKWPKATFSFTVEVYPSKGKVDVVIRGDYAGPLERLARTPMKVFLNHFAEKLAGSSQVYVFQDLPSLINEGIEQSKEYKGEVRIKVDECEIVFEKGKMKSVTCGNLEGNDAMNYLVKKGTYKVSISYS
jgi:hypothetical protein